MNGMRGSRDTFPIPGRLNLAIAAAQLVLLCLILWAAGQVNAWWHVALLALAYGIAMNSAYAMLHEAEHNILHPHPVTNHVVGTILALFFPAPFHLIRQGHIGHHLRNRSDDEAFDLYFDDENRFWKFIQLYGVLTGMFWALIYLTNIVVLFKPSLIPARRTRFNHATAALLESLNPAYRRLIQVEALLVVVLHAGMIWLWNIPLVHYFAVMFGFGFIWSTMQYVHHYGTVRDVAKGALNLRTFRWLDWAWLNHNWHLNHHMHPTVPWIHLRTLSRQDEPRSSLLSACIRQWRGPKPATERVENRYVGKIIH
jgi:fatty acid desaturase